MRSSRRYEVRRFHLRAQTAKIEENMGYKNDVVATDCIIFEPDILFAAVEKEKREMQAARKEKASFDQIRSQGSSLSEDEYESTGETIEKI